MTVLLHANTGKEFSTNASVDFNGVRLKEGGVNLNENEYKYRTMNYELEFTVTFKYLTAMVAGDARDFRYPHYIESYNGFYIKDQEIELDAPEYDENYHFDHWDSQGDFSISFSSYAYSKSYMGTTPVTLLAFYTAHKWIEGTEKMEPTCKEEGSQSYVCKCGAKKTEPIAKKAHDFGTNEKTCKNCGAVNPNYKAPETPAAATPAATAVVDESTVTKNGVTLSLGKVTVKKSAKSVKVKATLKKNGKAIKNKKITFKFNGKKYTAKTNKKGVATITVKKKVLKKLKVGKKITYTATYNKTTVKRTVKVKK
ncbi:MAG: hypothetical protein IKF64_03670 [Eubacterium sp.]|nr:hypothetical protein [Eubacterium sp.]